MTDEATTDGRPEAAAARAARPPADARRRTDDGDAGLLALIDRLAALLERSDLTELEVEVGRDRARPAQAVARSRRGRRSPAPRRCRRAPADGAPAWPPAAAAGREPGGPARPSVKAPLTGIFYGSPAPGSAPYVTVGGEVAVGQVIGLIEAMKLFNEIKSDLAGRVVKVIAESGTLVKAKQPLIEVEPL